MVRKICQRCGNIFKDYDATSYTHYCEDCKEEINKENGKVNIGDKDEGWEDWY